MHKQMGMSVSNKTLFIQAGSGPDLAREPWFVDPWLKEIGKH